MGRRRRPRRVFDVVVGGDVTALHPACLADNIRFTVLTKKTNATIDKLTYLQKDSINAGTDI